MGGSQSTSFSAFNSLLNQNVINLINQTTINSQVTSSSSLSFVFENSGTISGCGLVLNQKINQTQTSYAIISLQDSTKIENLMTSALNQTLQSFQKAINGFLTTAFQNQQTSISSSNQIMKYFSTERKEC